MTVFDKMLRVGEGRQLRRLRDVAVATNGLEPEVSKLSDGDLAARTADFRRRLENGEDIDKLMPAAFATVREASKRVLGMRHFDVQLMGGAALHWGNIAEMKTGEGKAVTVDTPLPTPDGWRPAGDIRKGDRVYARSGSVTEVTGVYPQGTQRVYVLATADGRTVRCNAQHLWAVYDKYGFEDGADSMKVLTTERLIETGVNEGRYALPLNGPVDSRGDPLPLPADELAYLLTHDGGAYDPSRFQADALEETSKRRTERGVPGSFLTAPIGDRTRLLAALVHELMSDGDPRRWAVTIATDSRCMRDGVIELARTLGVYALAGADDADGRSTAEIRDAANVLGLADGPWGTASRIGYVGIESVRDTGEDAEQVCFTVADPEHLFLVGDYVVTHNTLVTTLPSYLNALTGEGVHVVTVNDYLASYQGDLMGRVFRFLGLTTGCILTDQQPAERKKQYAADITYGTNNEFGFDYLRDNMTWQPEDMVQRGHHYAIVDEVDSILIDEARTPLIISGPAQEADVTKWYRQFAGLMKYLRRDVDYTVDEKRKVVGILGPGITKVEDYLGVENLYTDANTAIVGYLNNAIKAKELFTRDKDYVVRDDEVLIVDEHTGRVLPGRRYNDGLHQALEAKEGVTIQPENQTYATITLQNYFRMYDKLAGMTGTAETEAAEFMSTYKLGVIPIPPNKPVIRKDREDLIFRTKKEKLAAIVREVAERHRTGQPVLLGTASVEASEVVSALLDVAKIPHQVLNAKQNDKEAAIVAVAGRKGAVTVATNMAGRGTDIMLGGNVEFLADARLREQGYSPDDTPEDYERLWPGTVEEIKAQVKDEHEEVKRLGGLYVLGTERHESRRIDNQLRGRSGRQGDPGESRFYLSLEDDLMRLFNTQLVARVMANGVPDGVPLSAKSVSKGVRTAQKAVESRNYEIRKNVLKYDDVMNKQRTVIYAEREAVLTGMDIHDDVLGFIRDVVLDYVEGASGNGRLKPKAWDWDALTDAIDTEFGYHVDDHTVREAVRRRRGGKAVTAAADAYAELVLKVYESRSETIGGTIGDLERRVMLSVIDEKWRDHLYEMDYLKDGIGLRGMGQRDPLVEYQREGYRLYNAMVAGIKETAVQMLYGMTEKAAPQIMAILAESDTSDQEERIAADAAAVAKAMPKAIEAAGAAGNAVAGATAPAVDAPSPVAAAVAGATSGPSDAGLAPAAGRPEATHTDGAHTGRVGETVEDDDELAQAEPAAPAEEAHEPGHARPGTMATGRTGEAETVEDGIDEALEAAALDNETIPGSAYADIELDGGTHDADIASVSTESGPDQTGPEFDDPIMAIEHAPAVPASPAVPDGPALTPGYDDPTRRAYDEAEDGTAAVTHTDENGDGDDDAADPYEDYADVPGAGRVGIDEPDVRDLLAEEEAEESAGDIPAPEDPAAGPAPMTHADRPLPRRRRPKSDERHAPWSDGRTFPGTDRNAPCPCGSGRKYKMCHGRNER